MAKPFFDNRLIAGMLASLGISGITKTDIVLSFLQVFGIPPTENLHNLVLLIGKAAFLASILIGIKIIRDFIVQKISDRRKRGMIMVTISIILFLSFVITAYWAYKDIMQNGEADSSSELSVKFSWSSNSGPVARLWFVEGSAITPIYAPLLISFTNLKPSPMMIYSYWIEQKNEKGEWEDISLQAHTEYGKFYGGSDLRKLVRFNYTTFNSLIQNKNISSNETVMGWVFTTKPWVGKLRFGCTDSTGYMMTAPIMGIASKSWPAQPIMFTPDPADTTDLSKNIEK